MNDTHASGTTAATDAIFVRKATSILLEGVFNPTSVLHATLTHEKG